MNCETCKMLNWHAEADCLLGLHVAAPKNAWSVREEAPANQRSHGEWPLKTEVEKFCSEILYQSLPGEMQKECTDYDLASTRAW